MLCGAFSLLVLGFTFLVDCVDVVLGWMKFG